MKLTIKYIITSLSIYSLLLAGDEELELVELNQLFGSGRS